MKIDDKTVPVRQFLMVRGDALQLLESLSNIARRDPHSNTILLEGDGPYCPAMQGNSWAAMCAERRADDVPLGDLTPILRLLLNSTVLPTSDAPCAEVEAWLRTFQGAGR